MNKYIYPLAFTFGFVIVALNAFISWRRGLDPNERIGLYGERRLKAHWIAGSAFFVLMVISWIAVLLS